MSCNSCGGYSENFEEAVFSEKERFANNGINYSNSGCNAASASNRGGNNSRRGCDLYWQGFMAGFYSNNGCNQSAVTRTAAQAAERTAAAASRCSCCCQCNNWNCR